MYIYDLVGAIKVGLNDCTVVNGCHYVCCFSMRVRDR